MNSDPHPDLTEAVTVSRFWRMVDSTPSDDACWPWLGMTDRDGYGQFVYHGRVHPAHELALSFSTGEARGPDLDTCHACDNPPCCNPAHLRFDSRERNVADMDNRGRRVSTSKLTAADVRLIRERRAMGARQNDLAKQFGITNGLVSMIVRGIRWPHAGGPIQNERKNNHG